MIIIDLVNLVLSLIPNLGTLSQSCSALLRLAAPCSALQQACAGPLDVPCDASKLQQQKHRCEKLLLQCFPPGAEDQQIRRWHSHYSRKWCKELDCDVRNHREEEELRALTRISPLLGMISFMCLAAFAVMILLIGGTDDVIFFIYECGFIPHSLMRSWVKTRDGLRKYAGLPISHIS